MREFEHTKGGTLVFDYLPSIFCFAEAINSAIGADKSHLHVKFHGDAWKCPAVTEKPVNSYPEWKVVPSIVSEHTLGLSKEDALRSEGGRLCKPRDFVPMLGYYALQTGEQMPGFRGLYTFTDYTNTIVGSPEGHIVVFTNHGEEVRRGTQESFDEGGYKIVGLATRVIPPWPW